MNNDPNLQSLSFTNLYRYGFNTQEKVDEIKGSGNHYTAEFWEYDPRTGRRWNLDPEIVAWESGYASNRNNPISFSDPDGDLPVIGNLLNKIRKAFGLHYKDYTNTIITLRPKKVKVGAIQFET
ncbi:MAG: hypothetical protein H0X63_13155, partial [Flavobacteriales bacterium]|nr:hypothetical protein [Flavobacteriales bacterium]